MAHTRFVARFCGLGFVLLAVTHSQSEAAACSCSGDLDQVIVPGFTPALVPTDGDIWTLGAGDIQSITVDGLSLEPMIVAELDHGILRRWPLPDLEPGSTHELTQNCLEASGCPTRVFTVGPGPSAPPAVPEAITTSWHEEGGGLFGGSSSCGETAFFRVSVPLEAGSIALLAIGEGSADEGAGVEAAVLAATSQFSNNPERATFFVGNVACGPDVWNFDAHDRAPIRVGILDGSGRFSGWSKRRVVEAPGCAGGASWGGGSVLLVGLLLVRGAFRRRRSTS